jgi:hypothetical protein
MVVGLINPHAWSKPPNKYIQAKCDDLGITTSSAIDFAPDKYE